MLGHFEQELLVLEGEGEVLQPDEDLQPEVLAAQVLLDEVHFEVGFFVDVLDAVDPDLLEKKRVAELGQAVRDEQRLEVDVGAGQRLVLDDEVSEEDEDLLREVLGRARVDVDDRDWSGYRFCAGSSCAFRARAGCRTGSRT